MKIFIIANFTIVPGEKGNCRFTYLASLFVDYGHQVTLYTSSFDHRTNTHRNEYTLNKLIRKKYKIKLIHESGYKKHFGLRRALSHREFGNNLHKELSLVQQYPDAVYFSFPTFSSARIASSFAKKNNLPSIIDIIDIWPEALRTVVKLPSFLFNILVLPFTIQANRIYRSARAIVGVSKTYVDRASSVNSNAVVLPIFLGTDLDLFDGYEHTDLKAKGDIWLIYVGSLSHSYDIETVLRSLITLKEKHKITNLKVKILGSGPQKDLLEQFAIANNLAVEFVGFVEYPRMVNYLKNADIAMNAIVKDAQQSLTYKIGDYVSAGLPILNGSDNKEFKDIIKNNKMGQNYNAGKELDLVDKILILLKDKKKMKEYGQNSRKMAETHFNRKSTNEKIVRLVEEIVEESR